MSKYETTFKGILQILNDPVLISFDRKYNSIIPKLTEKITSDTVGFEMVLTVTPSGEEYTVNDYWQRDDKIDIFRERFYQKCIMFILFHWKNDKKEKIWEN